MIRQNTGRLLLSAFISTALLSGCGQETPASDNSTATTETPVTDVNTVATVNGHNITVEDLTFYLKTKQAANPSESLNPPLLLNELVNRELLKGVAEKEGLHEREDVAKLLEIQRTSMLVNTLIAEKLKALDLSDAALQAEYDEQIKSLDSKEYKASHILVEKEEEATAIIKQLAIGGNFAELAKEKSTGPTGANGGDLGWFDPASMVPEFGTAVKDMKKDEVTATPVKTQFGWHVIQLNDVREKEAPSFESTKERLKTIVSNKAVQDFLTTTRANADISIKEPPTGSSAPAISEETPAAEESK